MVLGDFLSSFIFLTDAFAFTSSFWKYDGPRFFYAPHSFGGASCAGMQFCFLRHRIVPVEARVGYTENVWP